SGTAAWPTGTPGCACRRRRDRRHDKGPASSSHSLQCPEPQSGPSRAGKGPLAVFLRVWATISASHHSATHEGQVPVPVTVPDPIQYLCGERRPFYPVRAPIHRVLPWLSEVSTLRTPCSSCSSTCSP